MNSTPQRQPAPDSLVMIGADELNRLVSMPEAIESSRCAFRAASSGDVSSPRRLSLSRGRVLIMPAEHRSGSAVVKILNVAGSLRDGRSGTSGLAIWIEPERGDVSVLVDGPALTALRTGAATGLATELLAPRRSAVLAMLGSGGQARQQIAAVCAVRPIEEVRVHSLHLDRSQQLARDLEVLGTGVRYRAVPTAREAVAGADVVCTATPAQSPLFHIGDISADVHINAVGSYRPDMQEIPPEVFGAARVVVIDQMEAALAEAGDLMVALEAGVLRHQDLIEFGDLLVGGKVSLGGSQSLSQSGSRLKTGRSCSS